MLESFSDLLDRLVGVHSSMPTMVSSLERLLSSPDSDEAIVAEEFKQFKESLVRHMLAKESEI